MALQGKFVINDAYYSPLSFPGVGTFLAFSGNDAYRNRGACGMIPQMAWIESVKRGNFRLHPGLLSEGCITLPHDSDFAMLRNALLRTQKIDIPCMKELKAYGTIEVIANGKTCS